MLTNQFSGICAFPICHAKNVVALSTGFEDGKITAYLYRTVAYLLTIVIVTVADYYSNSKLFPNE